MNQSMASVRISHNKYQQTTPTIEATLRAGVVIGHQKKRTNHRIDEDDDHLQLLQQIDSSENNYSQDLDRAPPTRERSFRKDLKVELIEHDADDNDADVTVMQHHVESEEEQVATPPTVIAKKSRLDRKRRSSNQSTPNFETPGNEMNSSFRMHVSDESRLEPTSNINKTHGNVLMTPEMHVPVLDLRRTAHSRRKVEKSNRSKNDDEDQSNQEARSSVSTPRSKRGRSKSQSQSFVNQENDHDSMMNMMQPLERRRRDSARGVVDNDDNDEALIIPTQMFVEQEQEVSVPQQYDEQQLIDQTHNLTDSRNRSGIIKTAKEHEFEELEKKLRDALRPHIPPPRRSERLRLKRVRKLQEKRIVLLDQLNAERGGVPRRVFNLDLRNVQVERRKR